MAYSNYLFALHYLPGVEDVRLFREHCGFASLFAGVGQYAHELAHHRHERLRIGYLSPDFAMQINAFFILPLLAHRTRERFDVYCYDTRGADDSVTEQMRSLVSADMFLLPHTLPRERWIFRSSSMSRMPVLDLPTESVHAGHRLWD